MLFVFRRGPTNPQMALFCFIALLGITAAKTCYGGGYYEHPNSPRNNPLTGGMSCPTGYTSYIATQSEYQGRSGTMYSCYKEGEDDCSEHGEYGGSYYNDASNCAPELFNPSTMDHSCVAGCEAKDYLAVFSYGSCATSYRPCICDASVATRYWEFGGSYALVLSSSFFSCRGEDYNNPLTGKLTCPAGYMRWKAAEGCDGNCCRVLYDCLREVIDECKEDIHMCEEGSTCVDLEDGYECTCPPGVSSCRTAWSSNLPLVVFQTKSGIPQEPKVEGRLIVINNDGERNELNMDQEIDYDGKAGFETRGQSSESRFPKQQYGFETYDDQGEEDSVSLLGLPKESDWILSAPYSDKTLLRNTLSYELVNKMGSYASRTVYVELFLCEEEEIPWEKLQTNSAYYQGVYILMEKIKVDKDRVDIDKLDTTMNQEPEVTGGYIVKVDATDSEVGDVILSSGFSSQSDLILAYPRTKKVTDDQEKYIRNWMNSWDNDVDRGRDMSQTTHFRSCMEQFVLQETSKNLDAWVRSWYLFKERNSLLKCGPAWDFNLAWGNDDFTGAETPDGGSFKYTFNSRHALFRTLMTDDEWTCRLKDLWSSLRVPGGLMDYRVMKARIEEIRDYIKEAAERNHKKWKTLGVRVWPNPVTPNTYDGTVKFMTDWLQKRLPFMDNFFDGLSCRNKPTPPGKDLTITEIKTSGNEFVELYNAGSSTIDLENYAFNDGIRFIFPASASVGAGEYILLAKNVTAFSEQFPDVDSVKFEYSGSLKETNERLRLEDRFGIEISSLTYMTSAPWPVMAADRPKCQTSIFRTSGSDPAVGNSWKWSTIPGYSPGAADAGKSPSSSCVTATNPVLNAEVGDGNVTFAWKNDGESSDCGYSFSLGTDSPPTNILENVAVADEEQLVEASSLKPNTVYYWSVNVFFPSHDVPACETIFSFNTGSGPTSSTSATPTSSATDTSTAPTTTATTATGGPSTTEVTTTPTTAVTSVTEVPPTSTSVQPTTAVPTTNETESAPPTSFSDSPTTVFTSTNSGMPTTTGNTVTVTGLPTTDSNQPTTSGAPTSGTPTSGGPTSGMPPTGAPPTGAPPTGVPPTGVPPTGVPPTGAPPTGAPPTGAPPTGAPPTGAPPTGVPPTGAPPTGAPPTGAPPTGPPPTGATSETATTGSSQPTGPAVNQPDENSGAVVSGCLLLPLLLLLLVKMINN